jgi:2-polyprenyl-3-methyl-5-hydroxy-6-metoxy-1,4-benzoquinol methylase
MSLPADQSTKPPFEPHPVAWTDAEVARFWDFISQLKLSKELYFSHIYGAHLLRQASPWVTLPGARVLDYGCGPGYLWPHLQRYQPAKLAGLDFSPSSVACVQREYSAWPNFAGATHVSSLPSPLAAGSFDVITSIEVIEHLHDGHLDGMLAECARLLRPGGRLLLTTPHDEDLGASQVICPESGAIFHRWQHVRSWTVPSLEPWLHRHGLRPLHLEATWYGPRWRHWGRAGKAALRRLLGRPQPMFTPFLMAIAEKT